jgi:hypothetical protein
VFERRKYTRIQPRAIGHAGVVMGKENRLGCIQRGCIYLSSVDVGVIRLSIAARKCECALHQLPRAVADPLTHPRFAGRRQLQVDQHAIDRLRQIGRAVEQGAVEVEQQGLRRPIV